MSLINRETGQPASVGSPSSKDKTPTEQTAEIAGLKKRIDAQVKVIEELKADNEKLYDDIERLSAEKTRAETGKSRAENEMREYRNKYEWERSKPPQVKYETVVKYETKCTTCNIAQCKSELATAKAEREKYEKLSNDQEKQIEAKVNAIVKKKTRRERFLEWLKALSAARDMNIYWCAIVYSLRVTPVSVFTSKVLRTDLFNIFKWILNTIVSAVMATKDIVFNAAAVTDGLSDERLRIVLNIAMIIVMTTLIIIVLFLVLRAGLKMLWEFLCDHHEELFDMKFLFVVLLDLIGCVFVGKDILTIDDGHVNIWVIFYGALILWLIIRQIVRKAIEKAEEH
ncbi:MAG: hypothetical protein J6N70_15825 [Oribacterium sp.]|nr:hypothetical protein [Oribacterium sp.]